MKVSEVQYAQAVREIKLAINYVGEDAASDSGGNYERHCVARGGRKYIAARADHINKVYEVEDEVAVVVFAKRYL